MAGQDARQQRVLGVGLEAAAAERPALDVYRWPEEDMGALCVCLVREQPAQARDQVDVEGRADGGAAGEAGGGCAVEEVCAANTVGAVRESDGFDAKTVDGRRVPPSVAWVRVRGGNIGEIICAGTYQL